MSDQRHSAKIQREDTGIMITRHPARTSWSRRDVLRGSAAALLGAYGLAPRYGLAADIPTEYDGSKFQMAAPEPNPKRGGDALRHSQSPPAFRRASIGHCRQHRHSGLHVRQPDPA